MSQKKKISSNTKRTQRRRSIDHIPRCRRKPRTVGLPRRRTDFSLLFPSPLSSSKYNSGKGSRLGLLDGADKLTVTELGERRDDRKVNDKLIFAACSSSQDTRRQLFSNAIDVHLSGTESLGQDAFFEASGGRNFDKQNWDTKTKSDLCPKISQVTGSSCVHVAPGSVVWTRTASQDWWPAECFEKRIDNSSEEFQDALKQALHQREHQSLSKQYSELSDDYNRLIQGCQTPEKWTSSSSRMESPCVERRRGKRERKPKLHFDEEPLKLTLPRGVRRIKIMRSLGLAAPVGSPF